MTLLRMVDGEIAALLADKGYDSDAIRDELKRRAIEAVIPSKINRRQPHPHDRDKYKERNRIERMFNKLKNWRRVDTRYDKTATSFMAFIAIASAKLWLPFVHET
jgi:transposase